MHLTFKKSADVVYFKHSYSPETFVLKVNGNNVVCQNEMQNKFSLNYFYFIFGFKLLNFQIKN